MMKGKKGIRDYLPNEHPPRSQDEPFTEEYFYQLFDSCGDVKIERLTLPQSQQENASVVLIYCIGICDTNQINQLVIPHLFRLFQKHSIQSQDDLQLNSPLLQAPIKDQTSADELIYKVFDGELLLFFPKWNEIYRLDLSNPPQRTPEEPNTEVSVKGPKDGFTEETTINVALIRKRIKSNTLGVEEFLLGKQTQTTVKLLYLKNRIVPETLDAIRTKLNALDVDELISSKQLEEMLHHSRHTLFPLHEYTGRPDFAINAMLHGKFLLFVEGSPTAIIAPVNLTFLFNTPEDAYSHYFHIGFTRLLRILGLILALFLPGFWIALITFHQDQIPFTLVATLVLSRQGVPMATPLEGIVMLLLFELFREAGLRLPLPFGQTLSVVGGLIIGEAAISAGLTAPGILVIVAISVLATFSLVNQDIVGIVSLLRIVILIICSLFGMFGFLICVMGVVLYLANLRSYGVYYLEPISPPHFPDMLKVLFRSPWGKHLKVPRMLKRTDSREES